MTITRLAFFKLLAAFGLGQATVGSDKQCLREIPGHKGGVEWRHCDAGCEKDEERCPLGHCQKPTIRPLLITSIGANENEAIKLDDVRLAPMAASVCSICGIVYVPKDSK